MSYENNHSIQFDLDHLSQYEEVVDLERKKSELDHVYAQAAKADEYEAKAQAFDKSKTELQNMIDVYSKDAKKYGFNVSRALDEMIGLLEDAKAVLEYFESGDSEC